MGKTKAQLRTENSANFPNNNSQFITPERLRDFNTDIIDSLVVSSDSGSFVTTASFDSGTRVQTFTKGDGSTFTNTIPGGSGGSTNTGSLLLTSSFNNTTRLQTFTKGDGSTYTNSIPTGDTGSFVITGSVSNATSTFTKGDGSTFGLTVNNVVNATSASHAELADLATLATNATNAVSASNAISSSKVTDPNVAYINKNNQFQGTQNFLNINVSGTGSFGRINSVTGSAKIIGDAFVVLNADTPTSRYAGIQVYDTGSASTASFEWDGVGDKWIVVDEGGKSANVITGPTGSKGSEGTFFDNVLPKVNAGTPGQLVNSTILDKGSGQGVEIYNYVSVAMGTNWQFLQVTGSGARRSALTTGTVTATQDGSRIFNGSGFFGGYSTIYNSADDHEFGIVGQSSNYSGDWVGCGIMNNADGGNSYTTVLGFQDKTNYTDNAVTVLTPLIVSQSSTFKQAATFDNDINSNGLAAFNSDVQLNGLTITTNDFNPRAPISSSSDITANNLTIKGTSHLNSVSASSFISASTFVGDGSKLTGVAGGIFIETGSYYATSNDLQVTGSFSVSKAIGGQNKNLTITSNTASVDLRDSNTYTVQLVSSADTHIDVTQFGETAQSLNLLVKQPSSGNTGSISFSNDFKFGGGYSYLPTPAINSEDILSFTRFGSSLYGTFINNFS